VNDARGRRRLIAAGIAAAVAIIIGAGFGSSASSARRQAGPRAPTPRFDVFERSILELQNAMRDGTITSRQIVEQYLARIKAYDQQGPRINAFIALNPRALERADALDAERSSRGARGPLHGIPIVLKDNYATADMPTTGAALALKGFETGRDAFQVKKLHESGVVVVGKANLHELAYGITSVSSLGGQTRNPYDPARNPGGSSGGTGAAVAASFAAAGMGTDTCGSIRIPAANNNLVGLRGTLGLASRDGIIPLSSTQDIGGPIARNITDLAIMLDATVGVDPADPQTGDSTGKIPRTYLSALNDTSMRTVRIGVVRSLFGGAPEDAEVAAVVQKALDAMESLGAEVIDVDVPRLQELLQNTSLINAEFKFDLADFLAAYPRAPARSLAEILKLGVHAPAVDGVFRRAEEVAARDSDATRQIHERRAAAAQAVANALGHGGLHALAYPTLRRKPAVIGQPQVGSNCQLSATTGFPALSVPAGFTDDGLPVGVELLGPPWTEAALLKMAYAYERNANLRRAPASTPPLN
jgi:Asp-tRNA(Asn)/Glu-tRNA(Gln) amidotransferase A subunit family amidase